MAKDTLTRFIFEHIPVRGMIVQLNESWKQLQSRKTYPDIVRDVLGEFAAANSLLASTLKFDGLLTMQIRGNGPINLLIMECSSQKQIRGLAKHSETLPSGNLHTLFGDSQLAITIDSKSRERYQGIVELEGDKISVALENYLIRSEQLETRLFLAVDENNACGLLVQKMPGDTDLVADDWFRITQLAETIKDQELFSLSAQEIIHRLFNEDDVRLLSEEQYQFQCSCTRERVGNMLISLGIDEIHNIIAEQEKVAIDCEFCNQHYEFDAVDAEELFAADIHHPAPKTKQ